MNRIRLERFDLTDIPRLISWLDSAETFWNWTGDWLKFPLTEEQYAPKVTETQGEDPRRLIFKAVDVEFGNVVGQFEISGIDQSHHTATIGRVIVNPKHRGRGVCGEMIRIGIEYANKKLGITHLDIQVAKMNEPAIICYTSAGFVDDGLMREDARIRWMTLNIG